MDKIYSITNPDVPALQVSPVERVSAGQDSISAQPQQQHAAQANPAVGLSAAIEQINDFIQFARRDLVFSVDDATQQTIVTVVDAQTQEVIRQIPTEEVLAIAARLGEARGLLFEDKA